MSRKTINKNIFGILIIFLFVIFIMENASAIQYQIHAIECEWGDKQCSQDLTKLQTCSNGQWIEQNCVYGCVEIGGGISRCADKPHNETNIIQTILIGLCIIVGFIILGLILRKKKNKKH